jgi:hypothetical protein
MGLMKLLGTSDVFGRILDRPSRYRLSQQSMLPKFAGEKRLEAPAAQAAQAPPGSPFALVSQTVSQPPTMASAADGGLWSRIFSRRKNKTMNTVEADPSMASASAPSKPELAFPFGRWTLFKGPFNRIPAVTPKSPQADAGPVQGELLLDAVKPVRNDLNDSDLEIVEPAVSTARATATCVAAPIAGAPDPAPPAWRRITAQFSSAEKP